MTDAINSEIIKVVSQLQIHVCAVNYTSTQIQRFGIFVGKTWQNVTFGGI